MLSGYPQALSALVPLEHLKALSRQWTLDLLVWSLMAKYFLLPLSWYPPLAWSPMAKPRDPPLARIGQRRETWGAPQLGTL